MQAYRDARSIIEERRIELEKELAEIRAQKRELAELESREEAVKSELWEIGAIFRQKARHARRRPYLDALLLALLVGSGVLWMHLANPRMGSAAMPNRTGHEL